MYETCYTSRATTLIRDVNYRSFQAYRIEYSGVTKYHDIYLTLKVFESGRTGMKNPLESITGTIVLGFVLTLILYVFANIAI